MPGEEKGGASRPWQLTGCMRHIGIDAWCHIMLVSGLATYYQKYLHR